MSNVPAEHRGPEEAKAREDSLKWETYSAVLGDTLFSEKHFAIIKSIDRTASHPEYHPEEGDIAVGVELAVGRTGVDTLFYVKPCLLYTSDAADE